MRIVLILVLMSLGSQSCFAYSDTNSSDSNTRSNKLSLSVLASLKPVVNWLGSKDSISNFMYSNNLVEVQAHLKRHTLGVGFNLNKTSKSRFINGLNTEDKYRQLSFFPNYSYCVKMHKKWKANLGFGYVYNSFIDKRTIYSKIENIVKTQANIEEGTSLFLRVNYAFNTHLSLEMETAIYATRWRFDYFEEYSLTPSMYVEISEYMDVRTFAIPSNISLKWTF